MRCHLLLVDIDELPVDHQLPSPTDNRRFTAGFVTPGRAEQSARIEYLSGGRYQVNLVVPVHGAFEVVLRLNTDLQAISDHDGNEVDRIAGNATCPTDRTPLLDGSCACEAGFFFSLAEQTCVTCPAGTTSEAGAAEITQCSSCAEGYFLLDLSAAPSPTTCISCTSPQTGGAQLAAALQGVNCSSAGITLETLLLRDGYWRLSNLTADIRDCGGNGCLGGATVGRCLGAGQTGPSESLSCVPHPQIPSLASPCATVGPSACVTVCKSLTPTHPT